MREPRGGWKRRSDGIGQVSCFSTSLIGKESHSAFPMIFENNLGYVSSMVTVHRAQFAAWVHTGNIFVVLIVRPTKELFQEGPEDGEARWVLSGSLPGCRQDSAAQIGQTKSASPCPLLMGTP